MKILVLANSDAGLYNFRREVMSALVENGNEVYISVPITIKENDWDAIGCRMIDTKIDRRSINPITDTKLLLHYLKLIRRI